MSSQAVLSSGPIGPSGRDLHQAKSMEDLFRSNSFSQKQCLEMCLQLKKGLSSTEKNCLVTCYKQGRTASRKGL